MIYIGPIFKRQMSVDSTIRKPKRSTVNATRSSMNKMAIMFNVMDHAAPVQIHDGRATVLDLFPNKFGDGDDERQQRRIDMALMGRNSYNSQPTTAGSHPTLSLSESTRTRTYTWLIVWGLLGEL